MSKYYEKVAVGDKPLQQTAAPSGSNIDVNAHARYEKSQTNNLGDALHNLIGTVAQFKSFSDADDEREKKRMRLEHDLDSRADVYNAPSFYQTYLDTYAKDGRKINELTPEEMRTGLREAQTEYIKANKLEDRPYASLIREDLDSRAVAFFERQAGINDKVKQDKSYEVLNKSVTDLFKNGYSPEEMSSEIKQMMNYYVGNGEPKVVQDENGENITYIPPIKDSEEGAKYRILQQLSKEIINSNDPRMLGLLEDKNIKEALDVPDYDDTINVLKTQTAAKVNGMKQLSYNMLKEQAYIALEAGALTDAAKTAEWFDQSVESISKEVRPSTEDIMTLKAKFLKDVDKNLSFGQVYNKFQEGDHTFMDRVPLPKEEREEFENQIFMKETGIQSMAPTEFDKVLNSGLHDNELKAFLRKTSFIPKNLELYGRRSNATDSKSLKERTAAFNNMAVILEDTGKSLEDIYSPEEMTKLTYYNRLMLDAENGTLTAAEVAAAERNFTNDIKKNTDTMGYYVSPRASVYMNDEEHKSWLDKRITDASWTTDDYSAQSYRRRVNNYYFSLAMESTDNPEVAREKAERMYSANNIDVEAPNGEETVLPYEFKKFTNKDFLKVANNHSAFKQFKTMGYLYTGLGSGTHFDRSISFAPDANYERNKKMNIYYGNSNESSPILSLTQKEMSAMVDRVNEKIKNEALKRREERLEQFKNK